MTMKEPELASQEIEEIMEKQEVEEVDRNEIRRLSEFLRWKGKDKTTPINPEIKNYILGKDV